MNTLNEPQKIINPTFNLGFIGGFLTVILSTVLAVDIYFKQQIFYSNTDYLTPLPLITVFIYACLGADLTAQSFSTFKNMSVRFGRLFYGFFSLLTLWILILSFGHEHTGWEYLGFISKESDSIHSFEHISPVMAASFFLMSLVSLSNYVPYINSSYRSLATICMALIFIISASIYMMGFVAGMPLFYDHSYTPPSVFSSIMFTLLSVSLLHYHILNINQLGSEGIESFGSYVWVFLGGSLFIVVLTYFYQNQNEKNFKTEVSNQLFAIGKLKSHDLQVIRREWRQDAYLFENSIPLKPYANALLENKLELDLFNEIKHSMQMWKRHGYYNEIFFISSAGDEIVTTAKSVSNVSSIIIDLVKNNIFLDRVHMQDFYHNHIDHKVYLATVLPVYAENDTYVGSFVFRIDPHEQVYEITKNWPVVSLSGEALLVRREAREILFLNPLRFNDSSPLTYGLPLIERNNPIVKTLLNDDGIATVSGIDYRGEKVLANIRNVPDSPWFLVVKVDYDDFLSSFKNGLLGRFVFNLIGILVFGFFIFQLWHRGKLNYYRNKYETSLQLEIYGQAFTQSSEGMAVVDASGRFITVNKSFTEITGYSLEDVQGEYIAMLKTDRHPESFYESIKKEIEGNKYWLGEVWSNNKDNVPFPCWLTISTLYNPSDKLTHYMGVFTDNSKRRHYEETIHHLAFFDSLTGLPNRALIKDRIGQSIRYSRRNKTSFAVLLINLDNFGGVNESLGRLAGDDLLVKISRNLKTFIRDEDSIGRIGGDEFVVVMQDVIVDTVGSVAQKVLEIVSGPYELEIGELMINSSIGISIYPDDAISIDELLLASEVAMNLAKKSGRNQFQFFKEELYVQSRRRLLVDRELRSAIKADELELYYQPQHEITSGKLIGCEALLRWTNEKLGSVAPDEFIPIAENSGQILSIDHWVLKNAIKQMIHWKVLGILDFTVAVNLSAKQFYQEGLSEQILTLLNEYAVPAEFLELEITEGQMVEDSQSAVRVINSLHQLGIKLSIDDFGTGYSSLSYLKEFKIDKLKIDKSFIDEVIDNEDDRAIVKTIVVLANSLGLTTIAEGVETLEQQQALTVLGCHEIQGYLKSKPLPANEFENYVRALNNT